MAKWVLVSMAAALALAFGFLSYLAGGPRHVYGLLRYALPQMHRGELQAGDQAPDVELIALDGSSRVRLHERIGPRPLVLIFGSYT